MGVLKHIILWATDDGAEDTCIPLFPKYWNEVHFLVGNEIYVYKGEDIYQENLYLSKQMIGFVKYPGYPMGVTPQDEAAQKHLKCHIDTLLLMNAHTMKEREIIFDTLFFAFHLLTYDVFTLVMTACKLNEGWGSAMLVDNVWCHICMFYATSDKIVRMSNPQEAENNLGWFYKELYFINEDKQDKNSLWLSHVQFSRKQCQKQFQGSEYV